MSSHSTSTALSRKAPFASAVPPTPGELAAAAEARWERRGLLQRLVRVN